MTQYSVRWLAVALLLLSVVASAQQVESIILAGEVAARIRDRGPFRSLLERSIDIDKRVVNAISYEELSPPNVYVVPGADPAVWIGKTFLLKAYKLDAQGAGTSQVELARRWRANFTRLFPLAEPCTRQGASPPPRQPAAGAPTATPGPAAGPAPGQTTVPPADWGLVAVILDHLALTRTLAADLFKAQLPDMVQALYADVTLGIANSAAPGALAQPPHAPGLCPEAGNCPGCKLAKEELLRPREGQPCDAAVEVPKRVQRRIESGLKLMQLVGDERYVADRVMIAQTLLKEIRTVQAQ